MHLFCALRKSNVMAQMKTNKNVYVRLTCGKIYCVDERIKCLNIQSKLVFF